MELRSDNPCDRIGPVLGPQPDLVRHMEALPHRQVAAADQGAPAHCHTPDYLVNAFYRQYDILYNEKVAKPGQWHGMFEVAERFYMELMPQAREIVEQAEATGRSRPALALRRVLDDILSHPEHVWFSEVAEGEAARIRAEMDRRYGGAGR